MLWIFGRPFVQLISYVSKDLNLIYACVGNLVVFGY
jgi:hypothetical protein